MSDQQIQVIRSMFHTLWSAVLGLAVFDELLVEAGLDTEWAKGVAVTLSVAVVIYVSQRVEDWGPFGRAIGRLLNGINRPPAYEPPDTKGW